jgi:tripartite ATP-independent transporter DctM subunit
MEINDLINVLMFVSACVVLLAGYPVALSLAGTALAFAIVGWLFDVFDFGFLLALPSRIFGNSMTNRVLLAVPLFVFMGVMLQRSRVAEELLDTMGMLFGRLRGGLGISVSIVGALLAASTGIVGATVVTMGLLSLPTMLKRGYSPALATGSIAAAGTLGQIIPPSIVLVILGDQISNAYADAQRALGNWSPEPVSVGDLFAGAMLPGLSLVALYILYQIVVAIVRPEWSPAIPAKEIQASNLGRRIIHVLVPPIVLIVAVLGSILAGVATPTEAAAVGSIGAILLAGRQLAGERDRVVPIAALSFVVMLILANTLDLRIARDDIGAADMAGIVAAAICTVGAAWGVAVSLVRVYRGRLEDGKTRILDNVMRSTMEISAMVFVILIGASVFSLVFRGLGGDDLIEGFLSNLPGGTVSAVTVVMLTMFVLGFFIDFIEITFVVVPIVSPVLLKMGLDPVWLGVMMAMNLQTSFMTPPFGFSLFYLRGVAPPTVTTMDMYKGVTPFIIIQVCALGLLALFPALATWLPGVVFG